MTERHAHGTPQCGERGCPRPECVEEKLRIRRRRKKLHRMGRSMRFADAAEARKLIEELTVGKPLTVLAKEAGLGRTHLARILAGEVARVRLDTLNKLRYADPRPKYVAMTATRLRVHAAARAGYSQDDLGLHMGRKGGLRLQGERITVRLAQEVIDGVLSLPEGGGKELQKIRAKARGYEAREDFDADAFADPCWDGIGYRLNYDADPMVLVEEYARLRSFGISRDEALERINRSRKWLERWSQEIACAS